MCWVREVVSTTGDSIIKATASRELRAKIVHLLDLETVIQSEVSQKEKNKYCILMHICGI